MPGRLKQQRLPTPVLAVSVDDAARAMNISRGTIYTLAKEGRLPIRKIGARSVILVTDMQRMLENTPFTVSKWMIT